MRIFPKSFKKNFPKEIDIRGEVYIQNSDFAKMKNKFANPRNAASGSLRQKDPNETKNSLEVYCIHTDMKVEC